jgi:toxin ParE1/3/4
MRYEFHPEAEAEFIEAATYYERNVPGLGERFGNEVRRTIELLLDYPVLGLLIDANLRKVILSRFPYYLIYSVTSDLLRVVAVAHARRRPGYWRSRVVL